MDTQLCFGAALGLMKEGAAVSREGWNAPDMFVYRVPAASYAAQTGVAKLHFGVREPVPYRPYYALKTAQGDIAMWLPSCSDMDADDWYVVYHPVQSATE